MSKKQDTTKPAPVQESEREPDRTEFNRFDSLMRKLIRVPKAELDEKLKRDKRK